MKRRRFRVGHAKTARSARRRPAPRGTAFRFRLSEAATVSIKIERALPGRKVGRKCRPESRRLRKRKRCTRYVRKATLTRRKRKAGANTVSFSGRIGRRPLRAGRYRVTVSAKTPRATARRGGARRSRSSAAERGFEQDDLRLGPVFRLRCSIRGCARFWSAVVYRRAGSMRSRCSARARRRPTLRHLAPRSWAARSPRSRTFPTRSGSRGRPKTLFAADPSWTRPMWSPRPTAYSPKTPSTRRSPVRPPTRWAMAARISRP